MTVPGHPLPGPSNPAANDTWRPSRYLEPLHPDNEEVLEQAAYQAAVTRSSGDDRKRKIKPRRTVDYQGGVQKWRMLNKLKGIHEFRPAIHPNPSDIVNFLPPVALRSNPSTSICDYWVHTSINKERSPTRVVRWTPDARRLLTGNDKGQFTLWNGASFNYESITQVHDDSIRSFTYSHNGQALVSADKGGTIKYFTPHLTNIHGFQGHREACHDVSWSPNDERFVTCGDDGLVKIWSYREAKEEKSLSGHGWDVRCVDWHPTKGLIVSGSKDMLVKFWDPRTGKDLSTLHSSKSTINTCRWSPDGHLVATAGQDSVIRLFDIRTFRELEVLKGHEKEVNCIEWHPIHHSLLVSGDALGTINYFSLLSPTPSTPITTLAAAHEDAVFSLSFHPLGHILCSGSKDFTARFWCRARPSGGQEFDKWHLTEEGAAQKELERITKREWGTNPFPANAANAAVGGGSGSDKQQVALPGLSNLVAAVNSVKSGPTTIGGGPPGLPGLGAPNAYAGTPPSRVSTPSSMGPPPPGGQGQGQGGQFPRGRAALPSQNDMLRHNHVPRGGFADRDRNGGGDRGGMDRGMDRDRDSRGGRQDPRGNQMYGRGPGGPPPGPPGPAPGGYNYPSAPPNYPPYPPSSYPPPPNNQSGYPPAPNYAMPPGPGAPPQNYPYNRPPQGPLQNNNPGGQGNYGASASGGYGQYGGGGGGGGGNGGGYGRR
ncbi:polyadenylation factor subunit 2 [Cryptococcus neoformans var. grubii Br795]|nr:polyadenylation factor subunit 2 [Cryptococcus neoformans var. grubii AD1-83a]OWZ50982.1 polyadenylation factor subunit 2 [Cryptococcus neoformans var. grubii 125.91]OXG27556.1 polyadenylation factor subunit 2 [Cryptococcus neoformans var. grubii Bt15]OXG46101.1 polyadenylation factor subunit 2 [Cryptococcus neoformans var. grubii Th84]OXG50534.1 polyadenylation factor subunit 2 [Cryptococcus neoformans var. grubii MW-RSA1955]OXG53968.1 polyadenylation factor subunit 2 [Cryptococcus neoform